MLDPLLDLDNLESITTLDMGAVRRRNLHIEASARKCFQSNSECSFCSIVWDSVSYCGGTLEIPRNLNLHHTFSTNEDTCSLLFVTQDSLGYRYDLGDNFPKYEKGLKITLDTKGFILEKEWFYKNYLPFSEAGPCGLYYKNGSLIKARFNNRYKRSVNGKPDSSSKECFWDIYDKANQERRKELVTRFLPYV